MVFFSVVASCSLVEYTDVSRVLLASKATALTMELRNTSETSVNFYQTARRKYPEDSHLLAPIIEHLKH
jgi:hypothetical protein